MTETRAAIDCGTNATRLLIASRDGAEILRTERITRLGDGVDATRRLRADAIERVCAVLEEYRATAEAHGATQLRAVATSAVRDASNPDDFLDAAERALGLRPQVLAGHEEGRLSFDGAIGDLDPAAAPYLVFDVGGGSTELAIGSSAADVVFSVDVGSVRLTERFLHRDPPAASELADAIDVVRTELDEAVRLHPRFLDAARLVGLGGTVTTMAAVEIGAANPEAGDIHHFVLTREAAEDVFRTLATERAEDRRWNPGLPAERGGTIVGGAVVVVATMRFFAFDELIVSRHDLLDALVRC